MAEDQPTAGAEEEQVVVVVAPVAPHEHAEAAHDVGDAKAQALGVEGDAAIHVGHAEHHVVDQLGPRALVPLAVPVHADGAGEVVLRRRGIDRQRLALEDAETDADAAVVHRVERPFGVGGDVPVAAELRSHRVQGCGRIDAPDDLARTGPRQEGLGQPGIVAGANDKGGAFRQPVDGAAGVPLHGLQAEVVVEPHRGFQVLDPVDQRFDAEQGHGFVPRYCAAAWLMPRNGKTSRANSSTERTASAWPRSPKVKRQTR